MKRLNSLLLALVLLSGAPLAIAQQETQTRPAETTSKTADAGIRERKNLLLLFPLTAAAIVVIAVVATRGKRRRRQEQAKQRDNDNA